MPLADVTIRYLEMRSPLEMRPKRAAGTNVTFARVPRPMPALNRFLYMAIGAQWLWLERRTWTFAQWAEYVARPAVETWGLSSDGVPAGYVELERLEDGAVELKYFGLLTEFIGRG